MEAEKANFSLAMMSRILGVSRSGYYSWKKRRPSRRQKENELLSMKIQAIYEESHATYGSPRVCAELRSRKEPVGKNRVARLMRESGICARRPKRYKATTDSSHDQVVAKNVLNRSFDVDRPNTVWAGDITCVWTDESWLYLAVLIDLFSRCVVGWSMSRSMSADLTHGALTMAIGMRHPPKGLMHHSDRGSQYVGSYRERVEANGMTVSMSRKGNCWDNAVVESFFATLKKELIYRRRFATIEQAASAIHDYIEVFYNRQRRHSFLGQMSPVEFERRLA